MNKHFYHILISVVSIAFNNSAFADSAEVKKCQELKEQIDHYNSLRKSGGSSQQMEEWKNSRKQLEVEYSKYGCNRRNLKEFN